MNCFFHVVIIVRKVFVTGINTQGFLIHIVFNNLSTA